MTHLRKMAAPFKRLYRTRPAAWSRPTQLLWGASDTALTFVAEPHAVLHGHLRPQVRTRYVRQEGPCIHCSGGAKPPASFSA
jgi:hypothetical protein